QGKSWDPAALVTGLKTYGAYELMLRRPESCPDDRLRASLRRVGLLKVTTGHPLIMHLLARRDAGELAYDELLGCLHDLESFVIRRSIGGESTRGSGEDFPAAIKAINNAPRDDLRAFWLGRGWPDDAVFVARLVNFPIYRRERQKGQVILEALEESFGNKEQ